MINNKHAMEVDLKNELSCPQSGGFQNTGNLAELCRLCTITSDHLIPIFDGEGLQHNLSSKINKYLPVNVTENDTLPQQLCYHCAATILAYHEISEGCLNAQEKLLQIQEKINSRQREENIVVPIDEFQEIKVKDVPTNSLTNQDQTISDESFNNKDKKDEDLDTSDKNRSEFQEVQQVLTTFEGKQFNVIRRTFSFDVLNAKEKLKTNLSKKENTHNHGALNNSTQGVSDISEKPANKNKKSNLFHCSVCNKIFKEKKNYKIHLKSHAEERRFTCHICGKQFSLTGSLYYHLKHVHEGVKNHTCDICGRSFAMKKVMEDHRRIHTGERPYVCDSCGKTFKTKAALYIHSKIHSDQYSFKCMYCKKGFRWKQQLLDHTTVHTGEKKHTCEICGKRFGVKYGLTRHKRIHSTEKPFICEKCGCSFAQKRYLRSHELIKHKT